MNIKQFAVKTLLGAALLASSCMAAYAATPLIAANSVMPVQFGLPTMVSTSSPAYFNVPAQVEGQSCHIRGQIAVVANPSDLLGHNVISAVGRNTQPAGLSALPGARLFCGKGRSNASSIGASAVDLWLAVGGRGHAGILRAGLSWH